MKNVIKKILIAAMAALCVASLAACAPQGVQSPLDPKAPTSITVWTYYNGAQMEAFEGLVAEFNRSVGTDTGIVVNHSSQGGINELADEVIRACSGELGAMERPNLAMVYPETAYTLAGMEALVELDAYFTPEELAQYIPSFIDEGRLKSDGSLYIFPIAKSSEILLLNKTDWAIFADETGAQLEELATVEGIVEVAGRYFDWTDKKTPEKAGDGKAFFGRDSLDNYMVIGTAQLGEDFTLKETDGSPIFPISEKSMRALWDNYYIPSVKGHFAAKGRFRSDDAKTGSILAYVGSTSSAGYFPDKVTLSDDSTYPITAEILPAPHFKDSVTPYHPQQGAGLSVIKQSAESDYACAQFLKWLTQEEQNLEFSLKSSYMPVTLAANDEEKIASVFGEAPDITRDVLTYSAQIVKSGNLFFMRPYMGSGEVRSILRTELEEAVTAAQAEIEGQSDRQTAIEKVCADSYFDQWFQGVSDGYSVAVKGAK